MEPEGAGVVRSDWFKVVLVCLATLTVLSFQFLIWNHISPFAWILAYPTMYFSARYAGFKGGIASTAILAVGVDVLFLPPRFSIGLGSLSNVLGVAVFVIMGVLISGTQERLNQLKSSAEAAAASSEAKYRSILDQPLVGAFVGEKGVFQYSNDEMARILGYDSRDEIAGKLALADLVAEDESAVLDLAAALPTDATAGPTRRLIRARRRDGSLVRLEISSSVLDVNGALSVIGVAQDVEERLTAQDALMRGHQLLEQAEAAASLGSWRFVPKTRETWWSENLYRIFEVDPTTPPDELSSAVRAKVHPDDLERFDAAAKLAVETGRSTPIEYRIVLDNGEVRWLSAEGRQDLDDQGNVVALLGYYQDVTARREDEEALVESERQYRELFESVLEGISYSRMIYDEDGRPADWRYLVVNPAFPKLTGIEDASGKLVSEVIPGLQESNPELFEIYGRVVDTGIPEHFESYVGPLDRWYSVNVIRPSEGCFIAVFEDITDRKMAEDAILRQNVNLERRVEQRTSEVLAANKELESFAYAVSHDLRAPLRAMSGFANALAVDFGDELGDTAAQYIARIIAAAGRMGELIDGLLALSNVSRKELQPHKVDVTEMAARIAEELASAEPQRQVEFVAQPGLMAFGDATMIQALLVNLLENAWKYTSNTDNARVTIAAGPGADGASDWFCVSDNGAGFNPDYADRLFQPFQRLHRQDEFPGIGIGLATCRRIVDRHGGSIRASGEPGGGATFCFTLGTSADDRPDVGGASS